MGTPQGWRGAVQKYWQASHGGDKSRRNRVTTRALALEPLECRRLLDAAGVDTDTVAYGTSVANTTASAATKLVVTVSTPTNVTVGAPFSLTVAAQDQDGNVDTSFTGTVALALTDNPGGATLSGTSSVAAVAGVATFSGLSLDKVGSGYTLSATSGVLTAATNNLNVTAAGVATRLVVTMQPPASVTAGQSFEVKISAEDDLGAVDASYSGNVAVGLSANPAGGTLSGTMSVAVAGGVADFNDLSLDKAGGGYSLLATGGSLTPTTTDTLAVTHASATHLVVTSQPTTVLAAAQFPVVVKAEDQFGNVDTSFTGSVLMGVQTGPSGYTMKGVNPVTAAAGVATFSNLTLDKAGTYTLKATTNGLTQAVGGVLTITPSAAYQLAISTQPPASAAAGAPFNVQVTVKDQWGNVQTGFTGNVTIALASNPGGATLGGTTTVAAVAGIVDFSGLSLDKAGSGYTLKATVGSLLPATTTAVSVTPAAATQLIITSPPPGSVTAGAPFDVKVTAQDQFGNTDTNFTGSVAATSLANPGGATLGGTTTIAAIAGVADLSTLTLDKVGTGYMLSLASGALTAATSGAISVTPAAASQIVVTTQPAANVTVGAHIAVAVTAKDQFGNTDTSFTGNVAVALGANPGSATLGGVTSAAAVAGVATFTDLTLDQVAAGYTLQATGSGFTAVTTDAFNITALGVATHLVATTQPPSSVAAGATFEVKISAEDDLGNVDTSYTGNISVALANAGGATLGGTTTVAATSGVADFATLTLDKVGTGYKLAASVTGNSLASTQTAAIDVTPAAATKLIVSTQPPSSVAAGAPFDVKITAQDQFGNVDTNFTGSVTIALLSNPGASTLGGTLTVNAVAGVADFGNLTLNKAETGYTLSATSGSLTAATTAAFDVTPGAATQLAIANSPMTEVAGTPFTINVIVVQDANGNVVKSYTGNVAVAVLNNPGGATLGGTTTLPVSNGIVTFDNLTLDKAGTGYTLTATSGTLAAATVGPIDIVAGTVTKVVVSTEPPTSVVQNAPFTVKVSATDANGNVNTGFTGNVTIALANNPTSATLGGTLSVAAVAGVATFSNLTLDKVGVGYTLTASSGTLATATSSAVSVVAAATKLSVATQPPGSVAVGAPFGLQISATDAQGNVDTTYAGNVTITLANNPSTATLGGTLTVAAVNGVATFAGLSLNKIGTGYTIAATSGALTSVTTSAVNVIAATASKLSVTTQPPATVAAGATFSVTVSATDAQGNVDTGYSGNVTIALTSPNGATLSGTLTIPAVAGVATFSGLSIDKVGAGYTLTVTSGTLTSATTSAVAVTAAAATKLVVTTVPSTVAAGATFDVKVSAEDNFGNVDTNFTGSVTIALANNPGNATLGGTLTVAAVNGVADFADLKITKAGTGYTLQSTAQSLTSVPSTAFNVTALAASKIVVTTPPPASVTAGGTFTVGVSAEDEFGNVDPTYTSNVALVLATNPGSSTLGGTTSKAAVAGVATFSDLTLNHVGTGYSLTASSGSFTGVTTPTFNVTAVGAATQLAVTAQPPASVVAGASFGLTVSAEDSLGNVDATFNGTITVALATNPGSATLGGTLTATAVNGVATFSGLTLNKAATGYTIQATVSGLTTATSSAIAVTAAAPTKLSVVQQPTTVTAGSTFDVQVSALDQFGNLVTTFTGGVSIAIANNPGGSSLGGTTTVIAVAGVADFSNLTLNKTGTGYTLSSTSATLTAATTAPIAVTASAATRLAVSTQPPANVTVNVPFDVKVAVLDAQGNVVTGFSGAVTVALANNPGGATLGGTTTVNVVNGIADFPTLTLNKLGSGYTLTATTGTLTSATTSAFNVANAATKLAITTQPPTSATAGTPFTVAVTAQDANGNVDTSYSGSVTIALAANPGSSTLGGTLTVTAVNGVATFSTLTLNKVGTGYTLSATSGTLTSATTNSFSVVAGIATKLVVTSQPPANVAAGAGFGFSVTAQDANGNVATTFTGSISVALGNNPGGSTLSGTTTATATGGVATFSGLSLNNSGAGYTLNVTSGTLTAATTNAINVSLIAATGSISGTVYADIDSSGALTSTDPLLMGVIITLTGTTTGGTAITPLKLKTDASGKFIFGSLLPGTYTLTKTQPSNLLNGTPTAGTLGGSIAGNDVISGIVVTQGAAGTGYFFDMGGLAPAVITINDFLSTTPSGTTVLNNQIGSTTPVTGTQLVVITQPPSSTAGGSPFRVQVAVEDAQGFLDTKYSGNVTLAIANNPGSATLSGTVTVALSNGIADFSTLSLDKAGSGYTLTATSSGLAAATTSGITVTAAAATQLVITTQPPASVGVGNAFEVKVAVQDAQGNVVTGFSGNVSVSLANNPGSATLGGTTTIAVVNGIADFTTLTLNKAGTGYTITASSGSLTSATTTALNVVSVAATRLVVTTQPPNSVTAGSTFDVKVSAQDASGNVDTTFAGNVTIALAANPGSGTLGGTLTVAAVNGVADFSTLTLNKTGTGYTLSATSGSLTAGTTSSFNVVAGAATQLSITTQPPSSVAAGSSFDVKIAVQDAQGNVVTGFNGVVAVSLAANPGGATLGGTTTVNAVNGVADFSTLSLNKIGIGYTLTASSGSLTAATTNGFNVTAGAASQLAVTTQPPTTVSVGSPFSMAVTVEDSSGNIVTGFSGNVIVALAANPGGATLGGTTTIAVANGIATFSGLTLSAGGTGYTLSATSGSLTAATTSAINVTAATKLAITTQPPTSVTSGSNFDVKVSVQDGSGNLVTSFNGNVTIALAANPGGANLGGTLTVAAVNGVADFANLNLDKVGSGYTLVASSGALTTATTSAIAVVAGTAAKLAVTTQPPASATAGTAFETKITVTDAQGNPVTSFSGNVTIGIGNNPSNGNLTGTLTVAAVSGVADFTDLKIDKPGTGYTLTATSGSLTAITTGAFNVVASAATKLLVTTEPPTSVAVNAPFTLKISATDAGGNVDTSFTGTINLALANNPSTGALGGTLAVAAVNGVANFNGLTLDKVGQGYTISATSGALAAATTTGINVVAGAATKLAITAEPPASVSLNAPFGLTVAAQDASGNIDLSFTGAVTVALATNPGGATLGGTTTATAVNGIATFTDLSLDHAGTGYTLSVSSGALTAATTSAINVTAATKLAVTAQPPASVTAGDTFGLTVTVEDGTGAVVPTFNGSVTIALGANPSSGTLGGTLTVAAVNGVAAFTGLTLDKVGTGYTIQATSGSLTSATTGTIDVVAGAAAKLAVSTQPPTSATAGTAFETKISVTDAQGNPVTSFTGDVTIAIGNNPSTGNLTGTLTVAAVSGVADFTDLKIDKAGAGYTLTATATGLTAITTAPFDVNHGVATALTVKTQPPVTVQSGSTFDVQISATDSQGNVDTSYTGNIVVALTGGTSGAHLGGTLTVAAVNGVADFSTLTVDLAGSGYKLVASSGALTDITTGEFSVVPAAATKLSITTEPPSSVTAGAAFTMTVSALDALGNVDTNYTGDVTVALSANPAGGNLTGTKTVAAVAGVADFTDLKLDIAGSGYVIQATSSTLMDATTTTVTVTAGAATKLAVSTQPTNVSADASFGLAISATDDFGNIDLTFTGNITIALANNPGGATLNGTLMVAAVAGVANFTGLTIAQAGTGYTISAASGSLNGITTDPFDVAAAPAQASGQASVADLVDQVVSGEETWTPVSMFD